MKRSKFTEQQIIFALKQAETGTSVAEACRKMGISNATYYAWKSKYGGMDASELKRIRQLEEENGRLKKMYADLALENMAIKDLLGKPLEPDRRRWAVGFLIAIWSLSVVKACRIAGLSRKAWYLGDGKERADKRDAPVIEALNEIVEAHPRWGFWMCFNRLRLLGKRWNHKRVWRVYKAMKLNLKRRRKRRLPFREAAPLGTPPAVNNTWSFDFMSDQLYSGMRFRILNIIDEGVREALDIVVDTSITAKRVVRTLEQLKAQHGVPSAIRVDNGTEMTAQVFADWCNENGVAIKYIQPGKPNQNAYIERFNRSFREEVLDPHIFSTISQVRDISWAWMLSYNEERPHSSLGNIPPAEFKRRLLAENSSLDLCP
ncbi:MAG: IS3 family transposase [Blastocatellia bacterium]